LIVSGEGQGKDTGKHEMRRKERIIRNGIVFLVVTGLILGFVIQAQTADSQSVTSSSSAQIRNDSLSASNSAENRERNDSWFFKRLLNAYLEGFRGTPESKQEPKEASVAGPEPPRRALPSPWDSPPFPTSEYQGYPLIGVPLSTASGVY